MRTEAKVWENSRQISENPRGSQIARTIRIIYNSVRCITLFNICYNETALHIRQQIGFFKIKVVVDSIATPASVTPGVTSKQSFESSFIGQWVRLLSFTMNLLQ